MPDQLPKTKADDLLLMPEPTKAQAEDAVATRLTDDLFFAPVVYDPAQPPIDDDVDEDIEIDLDAITDDE